MWQIKSSRNARPLRHAAVAVSVALLAAGIGFSPVAAQTAPEKPPETPQEFKQRQAELLDSLFQRLGKSDSESSAELIEKAVWQVWLRSGSDTIDVLMQQSIKAMNDNRMDVALAILDSIVELAPDYAEGWNKRATVLYIQRQYAASLQDIDKVLNLEPRHFGALTGMGLIKRAQGDDKGALEAYRRALRIHPHLTGALQAIKELKVKVEGKGI